MSHWIVLCQQVVGGGNMPFDLVYNFDHEYFSSKAAAIKHGFKIRGSDDFNVAEVEDGKVVRFFWMDEEIKDIHDLKAINEQHRFALPGTASTDIEMKLWRFGASTTKTLYDSLDPEKSEANKETFALPRAVAGGRRSSVERRRPEIRKDGDGDVREERP